MTHIGGEKSEPKISSKIAPKYLHQKIEKYLEDKFVVQREEYVINNERGIKIKYYFVDKSGRKKLVIFRNKDGTFTVKTDTKGKKDEKVMTSADLVKMIGGDKDLKFVGEFLKTLKGGDWLQGRTKKRSRKVSKKRSSKKKNSKRKKRSKH